MKLIFYGLLIIHGFREIHISTESTESYKLWISQVFVLQCGCDLCLMKPCCYFSSRIKFLHWYKLEGSESRSLFPLPVKTALTEAPPFLAQCACHSQLWAASTPKHQLGRNQAGAGGCHFSTCTYRRSFSLLRMQLRLGSFCPELETGLSVPLPLTLKGDFVPCSRSQMPWDTEGRRVNNSWRGPDVVEKLSPSDCWLWNENTLAPTGAQLSARCSGRGARHTPVPVVLSVSLRQISHYSIFPTSRETYLMPYSATPDISLLRMQISKANIF